MQWLGGPPIKGSPMQILTRNLEDAVEPTAKNGGARRRRWPSTSIVSGTSIGTAIVQESLWKTKQGRMRKRHLLLAHYHPLSHRVAIQEDHAVTLGPMLLDFASFLLWSKFLKNPLFCCEISIIGTILISITNENPKSNLQMHENQEVRRVEISALNSQLIRNKTWENQNLNSKNKCTTEHAENKQQHWLREALRNRIFLWSQPDKNTSKQIRKDL